MSEGKICDKELKAAFYAKTASVRDKTGREICRFERQPNGLYVAKLKLRAPGFGRPE